MRRTSVTSGFANVLRYPLGSHAGIVIARFPNEMPTASLVDALVGALLTLSDGDVRGGLVTGEPGRIRLRHKR